MKGTVATMLLLSALAAFSCTREDPEPGPVSAGVPMRLGALVDCGTSTRAVVSGTELPDGWTIWASATVKNSTTEQTGDYFVGREFTKSGTLWQPSAPIYWPLGSTLDMLALAGEPSAISTFPSRTTWNAGSCTAGLTLDVRDGECLTSDILYASQVDLTTPETETESVPLTFRHTQAWLRFSLTSDVPGMVYVDSVRVLDAYTGGLLVISRADPVSPGQFDCDWDFHARSLHDVRVPGLTAPHTLLSTTPVVLDILLPWQPERELEFSMAYKAYPSDENPTKFKTTVRPASTRYWYDGERYTFNVNVSALSISLAEPSVDSWGSTDDVFDMYR